MTPRKPLQVGDRVWKRIDGFDYSISSDGEVRNDATGKILKGGMNPGGYRTVSLIRYATGKRIQAGARHHQLVMYAFVGLRPAGMVVNHKNGIKTDNRLENLEYCTPQQNRQHAKDHRLYASGSRCSWSKLDEERALLIRRAYSTGLSLKQLSRAFRVSKKSVLNIVQGRTWKYAQA